MNKCKKRWEDIVLKKKPKLMVISFMTFFLLTFVPCAAFAAGSFPIGSQYCTIDGAKTVMDVSAYVSNNRSYLPVRYIGHAVGITDSCIAWDPVRQKVTLSSASTDVELIIGSQVMHINGVPKQMEVAPEIVNGRTFLPAVYIAQAFGYQVAWDNSTQTMTIYSGTYIPTVGSNAHVKPAVPQAVLTYVKAYEASLKFLAATSGTMSSTIGVMQAGGYPNNELMQVLDMVKQTKGTLDSVTPPVYFESAQFNLSQAFYWMELAICDTGMANSSRYTSLSRFNQHVSDAMNDINKMTTYTQKAVNDFKGAKTRYGL